jgi:hypothetical protein
LLRYAARPPLSNERLSLLPDGRLRYKLKRRWSDGTAQVIYEPMELMERLAALVPPPRFNITRYFGVLAPGPATPDRSPETPMWPRVFLDFRQIADALREWSGEMPWTRA